MPTVTEIQRRTLAILEARVDQVALLPAIVAQLSELDLNSEDAAEKIESLARSDPPLALRLMRLANEGEPGNGNIATLRDAIVQVGTKRLSGMIFALSVVKVFVANTEAQRNLWVHSIQTALAARRFAEMHSDLGIDVEEAFLAGLLHDIGRFMIFEHRPQDMAQIDEAKVADPRDLVAAEVRVCGFDHATLGYIVCERLHIPFTVCEMVRTHHFYRDQRRQIAPEVGSLVRLVQEADCLSFGLLKHRSGPTRLEVARDDWMDQTLRLGARTEVALSPEQWVKEIQRIDNDARMAASLIDIAYSDA